MCGWAEFLPKNTPYCPANPEVLLKSDRKQILTKNQFDILFGEGERNGINILSRRWPNNAVPYEIDSSKIAEGSAEETMIKQVVARFNSEMSGCINIV